MKEVRWDRGRKQDGRENYCWWGCGRGHGNKGEWKWRKERGIVGLLRRVRGIQKGEKWGEKHTNRDRGSRSTASLVEEK